MGETMETIKKFDDLIGGFWQGISFFETMPEFDDETFNTNGMRFCEALEKAKTKRIVLDLSRPTCLGADYAFGCRGINKAEILENFVDKGYAENYVVKMLRDTPSLKKTPVAIGINVKKPPDFLIAALQPHQLMRLTQIYEKKNNSALKVTLPSVMSICANVVVRGLETNDVVFSFGCDDARTLGNISRDKLIVGLSYSAAKKLI